MKTEHIEVEAPVPLRQAEASRLTKNSLWNLGGWLCALALNFVAAPIFVRKLGTEAYGIFSLLLTIVAPLGLFEFGLGEATVKYMAEGIGRGSLREAEAYFRSTLLFNIAVGLLGATTLSFLAPWLVESAFNLPPVWQDTARNAVMVIGVSWALTLVSQTFTGAVTSLQSYRILSVGTLLIQLGTTLVGITTVLLGGTLLDLIMSQTVCVLIALGGWQLTVRKLLPSLTLTPTWNSFAFRRTAAMGSWQTVSKVGGIFANRAQYWVLGATLPVAMVGYYNLGYQVVVPIYLIAYKVGQVVFPAVSSLQAQGREDEAARHTVFAGWICSLVGASLIASVICFAHDFLRLWVGDEVAIATTFTLQALAVHTAFSMAFAVPHFYLLGTGRSSWLAILAIAQGAITFVAAYVFVPAFGLAGAAFGVLVGTIVPVITLVIIWRRLMRQWISIGSYLGSVFAPALVGLLCAAALVLLRDSLSAILGWPQLIAAGTLSTVLTFVVILCVDGLLPGGTARRGKIIAFVRAAFQKVGGGRGFGSP